MEKKLRNIKLKKWELKKTAVESIVLGILSGGGSPLNPSLPVLAETIVDLIKEYKGLKIEEKKIKRVFNNLEKKEIISMEEKQGKLYIRYRMDKDIKTSRYSLRVLFDYKKKKKVWDGRWRVVVFDVPESQRNKRIYLKDFLRFIGFFLYQKSVYVFPYECREELGFIKKVVAGGKYIKYLLAEEIEGEEELKKHFKLG